MKPRPARRSHPIARLAGTVARLPRYAMLAQELVRDPAIPGSRKAVLGLGIGYVALPFDLIPGVIPVLGQLDDLAALLFALRTTLGACSTAEAATHLERVGLSGTALDADLRTVKVAAVWLVAATASLVTRPLRTLLARALQPGAPASTTSTAQSES